MIVEQTIPCVPSPKFVITGKTVELKFDFRPDSKYRMEIPAGMVMENNPSLILPNLSEGRTVEFKTNLVGAPEITLAQNTYPTTSNLELKLDDLLKLFTVQEVSNGRFMYSVNEPATIPNLKEWTGSWNNSDVYNSAMEALDSLAGATGVMYRLSSASIISATPPAGTYHLTIMAQNSAGLRATKTIFISITGAVRWANGTPEPFIHMPWSDNLEAVISTARQGVTALISVGDGIEAPCLVRTEISTDKWESSANYKGGPSSIEVRVYALDLAGNISPTTDEIVTVYLDKHLAWSMTPSPITMNLSTKNQIEERMNVLGINVGHDKFIFEHWKNNYRKPGTYYVDLTSESQHVTVCSQKNCSYPGKHPDDEVNDTFIVNIIDTPGKDIDTQWGRISEEIEGTKFTEDSFSKEIIQIKPASYLLPSYVPKSLSQQNYGKVQMEYHDSYRWVMYSNALDTGHLWSDYYNLKILKDDSADIAKMIGGTEKGFAFNFVHTGRLFGQVEVEFNLKKMQSAHTSLPAENLGLYRYNEDTKKLDLISNVISVDDGKWVSAVIRNGIVPTSYVIKEISANEKPLKSSEDEKIFNNYYSEARKTELYEQYVKKKTENALLVDYKNPDVDIFTAVSVEATETVSDSPTKQADFKLPILISIVVLVLAAGAFVILHIKKRGMK